MKKAPQKIDKINTDKVVLCLIDSHSIVIALSELDTQSSFMQRDITYAYQVRIEHTNSTDTTSMLAKVYEAFRDSLQKFLSDTGNKPNQIKIYLGDSLSHAVYKYHHMHRTRPFHITESLIRDMLDKDIKMVKQKVLKKYHQPHTVTHTDITGRMINGYPFSHDTQKIPKQVFSLEHTLIHTIVPQSLQSNITTIIESVYHDIILTDFKNLSSVIIQHISVRVAGSWIYIHIGESVTSIVLVNSGRVTDTITLPRGTAEIVEYIMRKNKISLAETQRLLHMVYDEHIQTDALQDLREHIDNFWNSWKEVLIKKLSELVKKGVVISKIIYSYDSEMVRVDESVFPGEPYELWYGSRTVIHVPCESILSDHDNTLSKVYLRSLLRYIQTTL